MDDPLFPLNRFCWVLNKLFNNSVISYKDALSNDYDGAHIFIALIHQLNGSQKYNKYNMWVVTRVCVGGA